MPKITPKQFYKENGENASTNKENAKILKDHFQKVFDRRDIEVDHEVEEELEELDIDEDLKNALKQEPYTEEVVKAIKKMKSYTSPGITDVTSDMMKALSETSIEHLTKIIKDFWRGDQDNKEWHEMQLTALYKGKGKTNDPNNWRGVCLKELGSKSYPLLSQQDS